MSMKIAVLSDTHNLLRPEVLEQLQEADVIFHGGDISSQKIVDRLLALAPLYVLRPLLVVVAPDHIEGSQGQ